MSPLYWENTQHSTEPLVAPTVPPKVYKATPTMTRSTTAAVLRSGVANTGLPAAFALLAAEEEIMKGTNTTHIPDMLPPDMLVNDIPTPETDAEADASRFWKYHQWARRKEMAGHEAAGTFAELKPGE